MITRTFKLCLNAGTGSAPFINVSQTDRDETWLFELYTETGERYIPSSGAIIGIKADGHGIANTGTVDSEGRVVITETEQMTAAAGRSIFELSIDGLTHGTANFIVNVEKKPIDGAIMSDSDLSLISQAVDAAATIEDLIEGHDPDEVIADAVDAWLDAHPEATTTVEDGAITEAKLNDSVKTGVFEDMTVGTSLAVMNDEGVTDNLAYKFRQTGGDAVRELDEIVGGTIAWNQLADFSTDKIPSNANGITYTGDGSSVTMNGTASATENRSGWFGISEVYTASRVGHKCMFVPTIISGTASDGVGYNLFKSITKPFNTPIIREVGITAVAQRLYIYIPSGAVLTNYKVTFICVDLTQMFGSAVADAICAMEQSSSGSGVAYFRSLFPNAYYAYNAGELVSVEGLSAHETVGFNQWDEEYESGAINGTSGNTYSDSSKIRSKNYIPVLPSRDYYIKAPTAVNIAWYDANKVYITGITSASANYARTSPSNAMYFKFSCNVSTYNHDICINLSSSLNGTYKPYQKHTYPLDSTLTLRGVPKWNNGLYFDGDIYRHDGSVQRRYGTRAYQSGDESLADAITDGTNTVYKLTTPTSETADPYQQYQICDGKGTEEYVSTSVTPVGHNTFYPVDIVSKVNKLPSDFSTLIAPTEESFKATRNYTVNDLLIVNNVLYKVTANIANGGTITVNTNVQQTTLSALIKALS